MKRGVINLNDIAAYTFLVIVGVILFTLFLLVRAGLAGDYAEPGFNVDNSIQRGNVVLQAYLRTPLDADIAAYNVSVPDVTARDMTFREALDIDESCAAWLADRDASVPDDDCASLYYRSTAFFESVCEDYTLAVATPSAQFRMGSGVKAYLNEDDFVDDFLAGEGSFSREYLEDPHTQFLLGSQAVPSEAGVISLRFLCVGKGVVLV